MGAHLTRFEDWPRRLDAAIEAARARPFCWGEQDCALFAAAVVEAVTGRDFGAEFRGCYASALEARRQMEARGGLAAITSCFLGDPVQVTVARRGDVVLRLGEHGESLGICLGAKCAFTGFDGLVFTPLKECVLAWRV